ncbi:MAG: type II toxin-antitoxin system Phd/YefM family antitoxin [Bifidobacteriaceae bacterium]|nr:type II toxin-antitoxin system Phd/YefM family antitoxin [Bifidobacteriaceae bacterium]
MQTLPLSQVKDQLSALVSDVESLGERIVITRNGRPAALIVSAAEVAELEEAAFWAGVPGIEESLARSDRDIAAGRTYSTDQIREWIASGMPESETSA